MKVLANIIVECALYPFKYFSKVLIASRQFGRCMFATNINYYIVACLFRGVAKHCNFHALGNPQLHQTQKLAEMMRSINLCLLDIYQKHCKSALTASLLK